MFSACRPYLNRWLAGYSIESAIPAMIQWCWPFHPPEANLIQWKTDYAVVLRSGNISNSIKGQVSLKMALPYLSVPAFQSELCERLCPCQKWRHSAVWISFLDLKNKNALHCINKWNFYSLITILLPVHLQVNNETLMCSPEPRFHVRTTYPLMKLTAKWSDVESWGWPWPINTISPIWSNVDGKNRKWSSKLWCIAPGRGYAM